ncbi:MAG: cytochrome C oxidase subunit IV family protein [Mariniblastus sp.]|nr:cytochrome C oxidase subunit IV family protein [Mariniblastus sp.]
MSDHDNLPSFCHPAAPKLLFGVFFALIFLTIFTVVTSASGKWLGIPPAFTFPIAMMIATLKGFLVCAFFMHMWWDKGFNIMAFLSSILFAALFISMTLMDTGHYQDAIESYDVKQMPKVAEQLADEA